MAQPPFLVDQIQIEPGSGDTLLISRDSTSHEMKFADPTIPLGILLSQMAGLRNVSGVFIVGKSGSGAQYTTIQAALDAAPLTGPTLVLIMPGTYTENLSVTKDGICLVGFGGVTIVNSGSSDTVILSASLSSSPLSFLMKDVTVKNTVTGKGCLKFLGADTFASGTITVVAAPLAVGDSVTIGGTPLTGVSGVRTPGSNNFSVSGGTPSAVAAEIAAALNDPLNSFSATIFASVVGPVVSVQATTAGSVGNSITLSAATTPSGNITVSGATLSGGTSAGSMMGSQKFVIKDCKLLATAVGGYQIVADTVNYIEVEGGTWEDSSSTSGCLVTNCALFRVFGVQWTNNFEASYNTSSDRPVDTTSAYAFEFCGAMGDALVNFSGAGGFSVDHCPDVGDITLGGDQSLFVSHCDMGDLVISDTALAFLEHTVRGSVSVGSGTPVLSETLSSGTIPFSASVSEVVTFGVPQPDTGYRVSLESPSTAVTLAVTSKTTSSFVISSSGILSGTVGYSVTRT